MYRVLVVDDSALLRRLISTALDRDPEIEVVGTAHDGLDAIEAVDRLRPDVVTLDVEMPRLDGIGAAEEIHRRHPRLPIIMFSTLTERGATATLAALSKGASDYVAKPTGVSDPAQAMEKVRADLVPRVKALAGARRVVSTPRVAAPPSTPRPAGIVPRLLVIACSTGGPDALQHVLGGLPEDFGLPVLVAQHMPPVFTHQLAERLDRKCRLSVHEATDGEELVAGRVLIAPGDWHLRVQNRVGRMRAVLDQGPRENFCRPAADPLLGSAAATFGASTLCLVLTGMGQDGLIGARAVVEAGGTVLVQDEATSVVWGMPGAVASAGLAHEVLPLDQIPLRLVRLARPALSAARD